MTTIEKALPTTALAIPNVAMIKVAWGNGDEEGDVVTPFATIKDGHALPLEGPGLGVDFDEALKAATPLCWLRRTPRNIRLVRNEIFYSMRYRDGFVNKLMSSGYSWP